LYQSDAAIESQYGVKIGKGRSEMTAERNSASKWICRAAFGAGAVLLIGGAFTVFGSRVASATPQYAAQTGFPCGQCHVNPAGGGKLKAYGEKFKANGHKVPK
jgi:hypothetical protein